MSKSCIVWIHWILFGYPIAIQLLDLLIWKLDRYWVSLYTGCVNLKKSTIQLLLYHNVSTTTTIQTIQLLNTYMKICNIVSNYRKINVLIMQQQQCIYNNNSNYPTFKYLYENMLYCIQLSKNKWSHQATTTITIQTIQLLNTYIFW